MQQEDDFGIAKVGINFKTANFFDKIFLKNHSSQKGL